MIFFAQFLTFSGIESKICFLQENRGLFRYFSYDFVLQYGAKKSSMVSITIEDIKFISPYIIFNIKGVFFVSLTIR